MAQNDFWMKLKNTVKDVTTAAADFTEEQALIGKLKFEILTLNRKADRLKYRLGDIVYKMGLETPQPNPFKDGEVNALVSDIEGVNRQIEVKRREIVQVSDHFRAKAAAAKMKNVEEPVGSKPAYSKPFAPPDEEWLDVEKPGPTKSSHAIEEAVPEEPRAIEPPPKKEEQRTLSRSVRSSRAGTRTSRGSAPKTDVESSGGASKSKSEPNAAESPKKTKSKKESAPEL